MNINVLFKKKTNKEAHNAVTTNGHPVYVNEDNKLVLYWTPDGAKWVITDEPEEENWTTIPPWSTMM